MNVNEIIVSDRIRKDLGSVEELAEDIRANGLINPITVNADGRLLAGERRLQAVKLLGWEEVPVTVIETRDEEHELAIEASENEARKEFSRAERASYMKKMLEAEKVKAKERQGERTSVRNQTEVKRADDATAEQFGIGKDTLRKELAIADNQDLLEPEDFADWDEGRLSTNKAYQLLKEKLKKTEEEADEVKRLLHQERVDGIKAKKQYEEEVEGIRISADAISKMNADAKARMADKIESLEAELEEARAKAAEPQIVEKIVEKIPDDYETIKADCLKQDRMLGEMSQKINEERKKVKDLTELLGRDKLLQDAERDIQVFTTSTYSYIRQYGGRVWAFEQIQQVCEPVRLDFIKSIKALNAFSQQMLANLEGNITDE